MARVTAVSLRQRKQAGEKIAVLTAYDYPFARLMDEAGVDVVLVGDSCAMAMMGRPDTLSITMDEMLHHTRMVPPGRTCPRGGRFFLTS
jgi:3-methyl-2-oxobutanoate hydroxymethyltransferase